MKKIKLVIFDFDGVVLESANIKTEAFLELYRDYPEHNEAIYKHHIENQGISRYQKFQWIAENLLNKEISKEEVNTLGDKFSEIVFQKVLEAPFIDGAKDFLGYLNKKNIPAFVASGTPQEELRKVISERGLTAFFEEAFGSPTKKEVITENIIEMKKVKREEVLFLGDAVTDYNASLNTNVQFIAVDSPEMHDYWNAEGVTLVENLTEIPTLFKFE